MFLTIKGVYFGRFLNQQDDGEFFLRRKKARAEKLRSHERKRSKSKRRSRSRMRKEKEQKP